MKQSLGKIKKLIKYFGGIAKTVNEIDIYIKYGADADNRRLKQKNLSTMKLKTIKRNYEYIKNILIKESNKLDTTGKSVFYLFCIKGKSVTSTALECYISTATVYRILKKLAVYLYLNYTENKKCENSVNYLINQLQNIL